MISQALGGVRLQVPEVDRDVALEILEARRRGEYQLALDAEFNIDAARCPNCRSTKLHLSRSTNSACLSAALWLAMGVFFPPAVNGMYCKDCGTRFVIDAEN